MQESLAIHKEHMRQELKIDKDTTDEKLRLYAMSGAERDKNELKYLQFIEKEEASTNKQIQKNDEDLLKVKLSSIEKETTTEQRKFVLLNKGETANALNQFKLIDEKLSKEKAELKQAEKNLKTGTKAYEDNVDAQDEIDLKSAENKKALNDAVINNKKEGLQQGLDSLIEIAGKESAVGKAAAIAQATINTYEGITKTLAKFPGPLGIALSVLQGVAGFKAVAEIAGIEAFEYGTDHAPYTGKAMVDEAGAELHFDNSWNLKSMGSSKGARITNIAKGDKIIPADISAIIKRTMFSNYNIDGNPSTGIDYNKIGEQFGTHAGKIVSAIKSKKPSNISIHVAKDVSSEVSLKGKKV